MPGWCVSKSAATCHTGCLFSTVEAHIPAIFATVVCMHFEADLSQQVLALRCRGGNPSHFCHRGGACILKQICCHMSHQLCCHMSRQVLVLQGKGANPGFFCHGGVAASLLPHATFHTIMHCFCKCCMLFACILKQICWHMLRLES